MNPNSLFCGLIASVLPGLPALSTAPTVACECEADIGGNYNYESGCYDYSSVTFSATPVNGPCAEDCSHQNSHCGFAIAWVVNSDGNLTPGTFTTSLDCYDYDTFGSNPPLTRSRHTVYCPNEPDEPLFGFSMHCHACDN